MIPDFVSIMIVILGTVLSKSTCYCSKSKSLDYRMLILYITVQMVVFNMYKAANFKVFFTISSSSDLLFTLASTMLTRSFTDPSKSEGCSVYRTQLPGWY